MTANENRASAVIVEFPARGRFAKCERHESEKDGAPPRLVCGGAWYHDEAIQQAEKIRRG